MCVIEVLRSYGDNDEPIPDDTPTSDDKFCLFGMHCFQVQHTHVIFLDGEFEVCPACDIVELLPTALWSLNVSGLTISNPFVWEKRAPPLKASVELWNKTAQNELTKILSEDDLDLNRCKFILHYILGLPHFIERVPLLKIFGESIGTWCGYAGSCELKEIAEDHDWDDEFDAVLEYAFKSHMDEKVAIKEQG
ncbi:hypothetical protein F5B22DRAFT_658140 [Xylaria bambusicola]|uniref:uncharacterized protein n=1 Tax=Xylaria bambusicola TaxID=326684 RepID=UPI002007FDEF|nr:uncharacterized protein F5B22DRAFT_658140 [Xylaria bambusicola]KAI0509388.1 hypothetical protein F5B22DRAFT_658140 [Xylaria bambusicola]